MAGQVRKIGNPETLSKEHFKAATFENIISIFSEFKVSNKTDYLDLGESR